MPGAVENVVDLRKGETERFERMALTLGMSSDELASTLVGAALPGIVEAIRANHSPDTNVVLFPKKR